MVTFGIVQAERGREYYKWHRGFAGDNQFLFPRSWENYQQLIDNGLVWYAEDDAGDTLASVYMTFEDGHWELGGLMVVAAQRGNGIGPIIARLILGHVLFMEDPLSQGQRVISHVHAQNEKPRPLFEHVLKFRVANPVSIPGDKLPGLATNKDGMVEGHELEMVLPNTLEALATWCESKPNRLKNGTPIRIELTPHTELEMWASSFRDMLKKHSFQPPTGLPQLRRIR